MGIETPCFVNSHCFPVFAGGTIPSIPLLDSPWSYAVQEVRRVRQGIAGEGLGLVGQMGSPNDPFFGIGKDTLNEAPPAQDTADMDRSIDDKLFARSPQTSRSSTHSKASRQGKQQSSPRWNLRKIRKVRAQVCVGTSPGAGPTTTALWVSQERSERVAKIMDEYGLSPRSDRAEVLTIQGMGYNLPPAEGPSAARSWRQFTELRANDGGAGPVERALSGSTMGGMADEGSNNKNESYNTGGPRLSATSMNTATSLRKASVATKPKQEKPKQHWWRPKSRGWHEGSSKWDAPYSKQIQHLWPSLEKDDTTSVANSGFDIRGHPEHSSVDSERGSDSSDGEEQEALEKSRSSREEPPGLSIPKPPPSSTRKEARRTRPGPTQAELQYAASTQARRRRYLEPSDGAEAQGDAHQPDQGNQEEAQYPWLAPGQILDEYVMPEGIAAALEEERRGKQAVLAEAAEAEIRGAGVGLGAIEASARISAQRGEGGDDTGAASYTSAVPSVGSFNPGVHSTTFGQTDKVRSRLP